MPSRQAFCNPNRKQESIFLPRRRPQSWGLNPGPPPTSSPLPLPVPAPQCSPWNTCRAAFVQTDRTSQGSPSLYFQSPNHPYQCTRWEKQSKPARGSSLAVSGRRGAEQPGACTANVPPGYFPPQKKESKPLTNPLRSHAGGEGRRVGLSPMNPMMPRLLEMRQKTAKRQVCEAEKRPDYTGSHLQERGPLDLSVSPL